MVCAADFPTFLMLVLIGSDSFSFLIANLFGEVSEFILSGKWQSRRNAGDHTIDCEQPPLSASLVFV
jgi:hypothetical protein